MNQAGFESQHQALRQKIEDLRVALATMGGIPHQVGAAFESLKAHAHGMQNVTPPPTDSFGQPVSTNPVDSGDPLKKAAAAEENPPAKPVTVVDETKPTEGYDANATRPDNIANQGGDVGR